MTKGLATIMLAATLAAAVLPAEAAVIGIPTGQTARVRNSIAETQQRNNAAIAHVRNSIAATRRNQF